MYSKSTPPILGQFPEHCSSDERVRRERNLVQDVSVRVTSTYYGPILYNHCGVIKHVEPNQPYPYAVAFEGIPGYPNAVRSFAWYEIEALTPR